MVAGSGCDNLGASCAPFVTKLDAATGVLRWGTSYESATLGAFYGVVPGTSIIAVGGAGLPVAAKLSPGTGQLAEVDSYTMTGSMGQQLFQSPFRDGQVWINGTVKMTAAASAESQNKINSGGYFVGDLDPLSMAVTGATFFNSISRSFVIGNHDLFTDSGHAVWAALGVIDVVGNPNHRHTVVFGNVANRMHCQDTVGFGLSGDSLGLLTTVGNFSGGAFIGINVTVSGPSGDPGACSSGGGCSPQACSGFYVNGSASNPTKVLGNVPPIHQHSVAQTFATVSIVETLPAQACARFQNCP